MESFFISRGICSDLHRIYLVNFCTKGLSFLSLDFLKSDFSVISRINLREINFYKLKLKILLKTSFNKELVSIISLLNTEILKWVNNTFFFSNKKNLFFHLDFFVYKLLWRHLKKRHPKKANTWIYLKYWANFSGLWKFFVIDYQYSKFIFLKSHLFFRKYLDVSVFAYKLNDSLNFFNLYNKRKLYQILFTKLSFNYLPNYITAYIKQNGLCFMCKKPFYFRNFKALFLRKDKNKFFENLIIVHSYCNL